ncbi:hypothetical protein [Klebsiella phage vB_KpnP_ZX1]|nr:hypothetical protein [Klebsiella phage vB_KpnP_ZX1]
MNVNELPQYKCHKVVRAGKILATARNPNEDAVFLDVDGVVNKWLFAPTGWLSKHNPDIGGYLVAYEDGYLSYSPAAAFEAGYSLIIDKDSNGTVLAQKADGTEALYFQDSTRPAWQQRVLDEKNELNERIHKLSDFIADPGYLALLPADQRLLSVQLSTMKAYSEVLELRAARF